MASMLVSGGASFAFYLLLAGTLSANELGAAVALAIVAGLWTWIARKCARESFAFSSAHIRIWLRQISRLPGETMRTGVVLLHALVGSTERVGRADERPFRRGANEDPAERARRATASLAASLAPGSYVVRMEPDRDVALVHSIGRAPRRADAEWLA